MSNSQIDLRLIEKAIALTGKPMEEVEWITGIHWIKQETIFWFSIEKFCYYLLSPEFIEKYTLHTTILADKNDAIYFIKEYWKAIYEYQKWNPEPLISLLQKI